MSFSKYLHCLPLRERVSHLISSRLYLQPSTKPLGNLSACVKCEGNKASFLNHGNSKRCLVSNPSETVVPKSHGSGKAATLLNWEGSPRLRLLGNPARPALRQAEDLVLTQRRVFLSSAVQTLPGGVQQRGFRTSPQRHIPPIFWIFIKPVAKLGAIISGRTVRKWWQALPDKGRRRFWGCVQDNWYYLALVAAALGGTAVLYYKAHIEETPLTGRRRFIAVTHEQFLKIAQNEGDSYVSAFEDKLIPQNNPKYERVLRISNRLVKANPDIFKLMGETSWKYYVVDDPSVNAFVLPTGQVFVFRGILDFAHNDDQLAIVIGHEMAHALLTHGIEQVSYAQLIDYMIIVAMAAIWCVMPNDGFSLVTQWFYNKIINLMVHMPYSRMLEKEADKVGLQLAAQACFDVREASVFWARMDLQEKVIDPDEQVPEWLSTHPSHGNRMDFFDFLIPKAVEMRNDAKCPALSTKDPRMVIRELSALVENHVTAKKTGQNLSRVQILP